MKDSMLKGRIVSNTGPIIALMIIGKLGILKEIFDEVIIPYEVHQELLKGKSVKDFVNLMRITVYGKEKWIKVQKLQTSLNPALRGMLDVGEASVIQLASDIKTDFVLIDERKARRIARSMYGLKVAGTARILVEAKRKGIVETVKDLLDEMRAGGYWIGDNIIQRILREAGE
jgi:predicted nucleic acid-binding protein